MTSQSITFNGATFRRYPESMRRSDRVYYTPGTAAKAAGVRRLHEEIWTATHGPIPAGHHIHHADFDPLNNDVGNLVCLTAKAHAQIHAASEESRARYAAPEWQAHLASIRPAAAEWHRSPEGRAWHRQHSINIAASRPMLEGACEHCSGTFESKRPERFCSNKCKAASRRASGVDDVERLCATCSKPFTINKYSKTKCCSRKCAGVMRSNLAA